MKNRINYVIALVILFLTIFILSCDVYKSMLVAYPNIYFSYDSGTYNWPIELEIASNVNDAELFYTIDGSDPSLTNGIEYGEPITLNKNLIDNNTIIKVIGYKEGWDPSPIITKTFTFVVGKPEFSVNAGTYYSEQQLTLTTTTPGATIRYTTDESTPSSTYGTIYSGSFTINQNTVVKAIAYRTGWNSSNVETKHYYLKVSEPIISPEASTHYDSFSVNISTYTSGATIRYTTDESTPSSTYGTIYSGSFTINQNTVVKAIAYRTGWTNSAISEREYYFYVYSPVLSPVGGEYIFPQNITMSTASSGATIRYTTDGSNPSSTHGNIYSSPVSVSDTTPIKAIAYRSGWTASNIVMEYYELPEQVYLGSWEQDSINIGDENWYYFYAFGSGNYDIYIDDYYVGCTDKTCDIKVSVYNDDLSTTYVHEYDGEGCYISETFYISSSDLGKKYIKVEGYTSSSEGTYAIKVTD